MNLTTRELATMLAALRYWQANNASGFGLEEVFAEHFAETTPLTTTEINNLCEKLNCSGFAPSKTHAGVRLPSINSKTTIQNVVV